MIAPIALVAAFVAVILVLATSGGSSDNKSGKTGNHRNNAGRTQGKKVKKTYTVKEGDSLSIIAVKTGVPVSRLSQLNSALDPQALITGTCIALRSSSDCQK